MLLGVISFCNEPRIWCSQQDRAVGKQRGFASLWLPLLHQVGWTGASGSKQCLCIPEAGHTKLRIAVLIFQECKLIFSQLQVRRCLQFGNCYFASNPFDLFGTSLIKAKPFSVRKIQNYFTKEHISFYPSPNLKQQVSFVQWPIRLYFPLEGSIFQILKVHNVFLLQETSTQIRL